MSDPNVIHYRCKNPNCPTNSTKPRKRHEQEGIFIRLTEVELDSGGREVASRTIYQCVVCGHILRL